MFQRRSWSLGSASDVKLRVEFCPSAAPPAAFSSFQQTKTNPPSSRHSPKNGASQKEKEVLQIASGWRAPDLIYREILFAKIPWQTSSVVTFINMSKSGWGLVQRCEEVVVVRWRGWWRWLGSGSFRIVEGESFLFMQQEQSWVDRLNMKGRWEVANQSREQFNNTW